MSGTTSLPRLLAAMLLVAALAGCEPAVGSGKWCATMKEKPKGDWSANDVADFARHCVLP